jgi:undecaprenyl-diphosphatase
MEPFLRNAEELKREARQAMGAREPRIDAEDPIEQIEAPLAPAREAVAQDLAPRRTRSRRMLLFQAYVLVSIGLFAALTYLANSAEYLALDVQASLAVQSVRAPAFAALMQAASWAGFLPQLALLTAGAPLALWLAGLRREAVATLAAGLVSQLLNLLVKLVVARPRPPADLVEVQSLVSNYSFPSGHVMFYTAFFGFLFFLGYTLLRASWRRGLLLAVCAAAVLLVGPSRIFLGHHWLSDVLAAYLLGSLCLAGAILLYRRLRLLGRPENSPALRS